MSTLPGIETNYGGYGGCMGFKIEDRVGLMVDRAEMPTLRFFVNGAQAMTEEIWAKWSSLRSI